MTSLAVAVPLALLFAACTTTPDEQATNPPSVAPSSPAAATPSEAATPDDGAATPSETMSATPTEAAGGDAAVVVAEAAGSAEYGSCHEQSSAGGASDGVLYFELPEEALASLRGSTVDIDVTKGDGSLVTVTGTIESDGIVFLVPLSNFGEVITIEEVRVDGDVVDTDITGTAYTVEPESDCSNHPEAG